MIFSLLEREEAEHDRVWDAFLHHDWIRPLVRNVGFAELHFVNRKDGTDHRLVWQSLAVLEKPE